MKRAAPAPEFSLFLSGLYGVRGDNDDEVFAHERNPVSLEMDAAIVCGRKDESKGTKGGRR